MIGSSRPSTPAVVFTPRATRELLAAVTWWRENRLDAPRLLDDEIRQALHHIAVFPRSAPLARGRDARRVTLHGSGYLLFYRVRPRLSRIEVISVLHGRRWSA